jgi:hypothetical protein
MNDDELRGLIRAAIQRHMGSAESSGPVRPKPDATPPGAPVPPPLSISFAQYQLQRADGDTMCIVEPAVQCNHCGFCKCHGH